jgi:hypothetical protein
MFAREELLDVLRTGTVNVTFTKKDGTERNMRCTLREAMIPTEALPTGESTRKKSDAVISVFDLEKDDWRSFRVDSVTSYQVE